MIDLTNSREIAGCRLTSIINNEAEHPGLGVSLLYACPSVKVALYIYDSQRKDITADIYSEVVRTAFDEARSQVYQVFPGCTDVGADSVCAVSDFLCYRSIFEFGLQVDSGEVRHLTHLYFGSLGKHFFKIRATHVKTPEGESVVQNFVAEFLGIFKN